MIDGVSGWGQLVVSGRLWLFVCMPRVGGKHSGMPLSPPLPLSPCATQGPLPEPAYSHAQRWGRAFVPEPLGTEFLFLPAQRLALCGDACTGSSVEAAWRSGRAAGDAVARMLLSAA